MEDRLIIKCDHIAAIDLQTQEWGADIYLQLDQRVFKSLSEVHLIVSEESYIENLFRLYHEAKEITIISGEHCIVAWK